jgi:UDP-N-acetylglucosamine--N-acetylmuramyl-(pentapeptide) pyrophosphoryl-undecaprenol N-acetylglucosamine transferase
VKVVIAGGGTGGHIYPGLATAAELKRRGAGIFWFGTGAGPERRLVPQEGFDFIPIKATSLSGVPSLSIFKKMARLGAGFFEARSCLRRIRPDLVIGFGGYVSVPAVTAALMTRVPMLLAEQNVLPGKVNRFFASRAAAVAVSYDESLQYLRGAKVTVTGNPVRREIMLCREMTKEERCEIITELGLSSGRMTVLIFGGSSGAASINRAALDAVHLLGDREDLQFLHLTGRDGFEFVRDHMPKTGRAIYRIMPYMDDMYKALALADLAVCRAGATTVSELACCGCPAIMVPYPYAMENHQEYNARLLEREGGAQVILDDRLNGDDLAGRIEMLACDRQELERMGQAVRSLAKDDAAVRIADLAENIMI